MKKILLILFVASIIVACTKEPKIDYVLISGKIDNPAENALVIKGYGFKKIINLNDGGVFSDTLKIVTNGYYTLNYYMESSDIYLNNGDNLHITVNAKTFDETIAYTGVEAKANNYLAAKNLHNKQNKPDYPKLWAKEEADFLKDIEKLKTNNEAFLNKAEGLNESFRALEEKSNYYNYLVLLQKYKTYHGEFANIKGYKTSKEFDTIQQLALKQITFTNDYDYNSFHSYKEMSDHYYFKKFKNTNNLSAFMEELKSIPVNAKKTISERLIRRIRPNNEQNETLFNGLMQINTQKKFRERLKISYERVKKLVKKMPSPVFINYKNFKGGKTSLEDFRGKYVYIDVWATWCKPCTYEIPFLNEIENKYHNKNIEFVSISVDKGKKGYDSWVQMVNDKELGGVQLIADNSFNSDFIEKYNINGIPRFILIDPKGNIVNADSPRPSSPKLIELFNELKL